MSRGVEGWQSDKTVLQRNRHMLEHAVATDACFEVGTSQSNTIVVRAHKYMLISASPVFQAMFCGGLAETTTGNDGRPIKVEDIQGKTFYEMLRYIYYEECSVSGENALQLMYAAHKYMIPNLVKFCEKFLEDGLNSENVCCILEHSLTFGAEELKQRCLALIALNSSEIMESKDFNEINMATLDAVLDMDRMECSESLLYQACVGWAKHQLRNKKGVGLHFLSDQTIRDTLGRLLYKIRFPAMDQKEFTESTADSEVLSPQEKLSIFYFLANGNKKETLAFICKPRDKCFEKFCSRQTRLNNTQYAQYGNSFPPCGLRFASACTGATGHSETLTFKTSDNILLTGIQLIVVGLGLYNGGHTQWKHTFTVSISYEKEVVTKQLLEASEDSNTGQNKLVLVQPTFVTKARTYTLTVTCSCMSAGSYGYDEMRPYRQMNSAEYRKECILSFSEPFDKHSVSGLYYKL